MKPRENWFASANDCYLRTIEGYDRSVSESISSAVSSHCGVKFSSQMNLLDYFHVCAPGLPPCLAHDLFEGIVPQDVMIYLKHFVQLGWFTIDYFNERIREFSYDRSSAACKPVPIRRGCSKLLGNASQN